MFPTFRYRLGYIYTSYIMALSILAACSSLPVSQPTPTQDGDIRKPLQPRDLKIGECGLFVWLGENLQFSVFSQNGETAFLAQDGIENILHSQEKPRPADNYGQYPQQVFQDKNGREYRLNLSRAKAVDGGIRYAGGVWRTQDENGWDLVKPAYGFSTCLQETVK